MEQLETELSHLSLVQHEAGVFRILILLTLLSIVSFEMNFWCKKRRKWTTKNICLALHTGLSDDIKPLIGLIEINNYYSNNNYLCWQNKRKKALESGTLMI